MPKTQSSTARRVAKAQRNPPPPRKHVVPRVSDISLLTVGIAAPLMVLPLMILWGQRELTHDELAAMIVRMIVYGCREQNPGRSAEHWGALGG